MPLSSFPSPPARALLVPLQTVDELAGASCCAVDEPGRCEGGGLALGARGIATGAHGGGGHEVAVLVAAHDVPAQVAAEDEAVDPGEFVVAERATGARRCGGSTVLMLAGVGIYGLMRPAWELLLVLTARSSVQSSRSVAVGSQGRGQRAVIRALAR